MEHHSVDKGLTVGPDMNMKHQLREELPVVIVEHNLLLAWVHAGQSPLGNLVPDIAGELAGVKPVPRNTCWCGWMASRTLSRAMVAFISPPRLSFFT